MIFFTMLFLFLKAYPPPEKSIIQQPEQQKANYASKMYLKLGFEIIKTNEEDYIMICKL